MQTKHVYLFANQICAYIFLTLVVSTFESIVQTHVCFLACLQTKHMSTFLIVMQTKLYLSFYLSKQQNSTLNNLQKVDIE